MKTTLIMVAVVALPDFSFVHTTAAGQASPMRVVAFVNGTDGRVSHLSYSDSVANSTRHVTDNLRRPQNQLGRSR